MVKSLAGQMVQSAPRVRRVMHARIPQVTGIPRCSPHADANPVGEKVPIALKVPRVTDAAKALLGYGAKPVFTVNDIELNFFCYESLNSRRMCAI